MSAPLLALLAFDLALIGALPRLFFRAGHLNLRWWLTAAPFFAAGTLLIATACGWMDPLVPATAPVHAALEVAAALLSATSIALIAFTCGTHRRPPALWHQANDEPDDLVTVGAYARMRHPFYSAFLLALCAVAVAAPHPLTLGLFAYGFAALNATAAREERRLRTSHLGDRYERYIARTHRFHPRLRGTVR